MLTPSEREKLMSEVLDAKGTILLCCPDHKYYASMVPPAPNGCKYCWFSYFMYELCTTPPDKRYERVQEMESSIHHMKELIEAGKWDFEPSYEISFEENN